MTWVDLCELVHSPEASVHPEGNVPGRPQRLHVLEVGEVVHLDASLPPL